MSKAPTTGAVIQRAFREALLALPAEEFDWLDIRARTFRSAAIGADGAGSPETLERADGALPGKPETPRREWRRSVLPALLAALTETLDLWYLSNSRYQKRLKS
jgi:hypothetical protein